MNLLEKYSNMDIKLNDFIKITKEFAEGVDNLPSGECVDNYQELEIQVVGRKLNNDGSINKYLCTITLDGEKYGWKAIRYGADILNDNASAENLKRLYEDVGNQLYWYISPKDIECVVGSRKTSAAPFQVKDEQLRKDVGFFFKDLTEEWVSPGKNGFEFL